MHRQNLKLEIVIRGDVKMGTATHHGSLLHYRVSWMCCCPLFRAGKECVGRGMKKWYSDEWEDGIWEK